MSFSSCRSLSRRLAVFLGCVLALCMHGCQLDIAVSDGGQARPNTAASQACATNVDAGAYCGQFSASTIVEVVPVAKAGYEFTGWVGDCAGMGLCKLNMSADHTVRAQFTPLAALALHDTTTDIEALLENGKLDGACDRYNQSPSTATPYLTKLCGKWMFFYEGFGLQGVPRPIVTFMIKNLPLTVGNGFTRYGMIEDPHSTDHLPLGFAPGATVSGVQTLSYSCASCHFGKTSDGRYSVGMANHDYDYGKQLMAMSLLPSVATMSPATAKAQLDPAMQALLQPHLDELKSQNAYLALINSLVQLTPLLVSGTPVPNIDIPLQQQYLGWKSGTQDFLIAPVGTDDHVHTVSKILPLWNMYTLAEMQAKGGQHMMLGFTGTTQSMDHFLKGFVALSAGDKTLYTPEGLLPLQSYLLSLKAPTPLQTPDPTLVAYGRQVFNDQGCAVCHNGPSYSSTRAYAFDEVATDAALKRWADPNLTGITNVPSVVMDPLTHGVKSPRLVGLWAQKRFLHNGSVDTLPDLLCESLRRPTRTDEPYGDQGHTMGCDNLSAPDKKALLAFLGSL